MKKRKNSMLILATIALMLAANTYIFVVYTAYHGALFERMMSLLIVVPIIGLTTLWQILRGKLEGKPPKFSSQVILALLILIGAVLIGRELWQSRGYSLSAILMGVFTVALLPFAYLELKNQGRPLKHPIPFWAGVMSGVYLVIVIVTFGYLQIVQPTTVAEATAIVAEEYGADSYELAAHIEYQEPLGVYWFAQRDADLPGWIEVDVLTGEMRVK